MKIRKSASGEIFIIPRAQNELFAGSNGPRFERFAGILALIDRGYWQSILVVSCSHPTPSNDIVQMAYFFRLASDDVGDTQYVPILTK